jgi:hypothetical protein
MPSAPRVRFVPVGAVIVAALGAVTARVDATTVMQLNLGELVQRAEKIYRGKVLSISAGVVDVGGGQLPTLTSRLQVEEVFRGEFPTVKGIRIAEVRMLGSKTSDARVGNLQRLSVLPKMPQLLAGETYLLFTTAPSAIGLSTTVGLGQGSFHVFAVGKDETAVNEANNSGLFRDMGAPSGARVATSAGPSAGPIPYRELADHIRALVGQ